MERIRCDMICKHDVKVDEMNDRSQTLRAQDSVYYDHQDTH